jgi:GNAT superfamily N-acetyltransferase
VTADGWREGYREIVSRQKLGDLPADRWRHEVRVGLRRPVGDAFTYVGEIDGEFAGYCFVAAPGRDADLGPGVAEVVAMYVAPSHWRKGVGAALMEAAIERLERLPYDDAVLWTFRGNARAIAFYERFGWRADGAEKVHARSGEPAIRLRRSVTMPST